MGVSPIRFPGMGLEFNINPIAFSIFGKDVYWYGIIISVAFLVCIILAQRDARKFDINPEYIIDLVLFVIPAAIIGARLYYVLFKWKEYVSSPADILAIWKGGLAIYGAILASIVVAYLFAKHKKMDIYKLFDFLIPYLALGQAIGRWGNFVNQEAYGVQTTLPWRMEITSLDNLSRISVHPTFLYEFVWNLGLFIFLIWYRKKERRLPGEVFFLYMVLYGLGRFWIEGLRTDSLMMGPLRISQVLAGIFVVLFSTIIIVRKKWILSQEGVLNIHKSALIQSRMQKNKKNTKI